jgi:hypothetical protein
MTVQELIARLSTFDSALHVIMPGKDEDFTQVDSVFEDLVEFRGGVVMLADERETGWKKVVRLFGPDR